MVSGQIIFFFFCYRRKKFLGFFLRCIGERIGDSTFLKFGDCSFSHLICRKEENSKSRINFWQYFLDTIQELVII